MSSFTAKRRTLWGASKASSFSFWNCDRHYSQINRQGLAKTSFLRIVCPEFPRLETLQHEPFDKAQVVHFSQPDHTQRSPTGWTPHYRIVLFAYGSRGTNEHHTILRQSALNGWLALLRALQWRSWFVPRLRLKMHCQTTLLRNMQWSMLVILQIQRQQTWEIFALLDKSAFDLLILDLFCHWLSFNSNPDRLV